MYLLDMFAVRHAIKPQGVQPSAYRKIMKTKTVLTFDDEETRHIGHPNQSAVHRRTVPGTSTVHAPRTCARHQAPVNGDGQGRKINYESELNTAAAPIWALAEFAPSHSPVTIHNGSECRPRRPLTPDSS